MSKEIKIILISLIACLTMGLCFQVGYYSGINDETHKVSDDPYLDSITEVWNRITEDYVDNDSIDYELLSRHAIEGMLDYLGDPYSLYLNQKTYKQDKIDTSGKYGGIGVLISIIDERPVVLTVYDNSPALQAGLAPGDLILEVDGVDTEGITLTELVLRVRGENGTTVVLKLLHQGDTEAVVTTVTRAVIDAPSVYYEMIDSIAYIHIDGFTEDTDEEFVKVLETVTDAGASGIILDLRDNPGGLLTTVINITSCFYSKGDILTVRYNDGSTKKYTTNKQDIVTDLSMVVLVNENSASASEVITGALQDYDRALIVGKTTYGKGSVNIMVGLSDGGGLYITTARWLTPNGNLIEGIGITPDIKSELTGDELVQWAADYLNNNP